MNNTDKIIEELKKAQCLNDDELSLITGISPRQQVNQICNRLANKGIIIREVGRAGKIVNVLAPINIIKITKKDTIGKHSFNPNSSRSQKSTVIAEHRQLYHSIPVNNPVSLSIDKRTLLIIPCCKSKKEGGEEQADLSSNLNLSSMVQERLLQARKSIYNYILEPDNTLLRSGNVNLISNIDFGGKCVGGLYMKAIDRYVGNLYKAIFKKEELSVLGDVIGINDKDRQRPMVMILSALYGPLHPLDPIQDYELKMDNKRVKAVWKEELYPILSDFVQRNNINKIVLYAGSSSAYFSILKPVLKKLLENKLVAETFQYHIFAGGPSVTPSNHGLLFYSDLMGNSNIRLSRMVQLRQGPDFLSLD